MTTLFVNIGHLTGILPENVLRLEGEAMSKVVCLSDSWLLTKDGVICDYGEMKAQPEIDADEIIDVKGAMIMPTFCDSHTHC